MRGRRVTAAVGAVVVLALAGCGDSGAEQASSGLAAPAAGPVEQQAGQQPQEQARDTAAKAPEPAVAQRSIIYTGSLTVRVDDVNASAARATGIVTGAGGFVGGDKRTSNGDRGSADATLELRVPAGRFSAVVDQLARLGTEEQRGISTEDVTEETIDLDARIATQQARVDSGRRLLAQAKDLEDLVMLEREVATREADLASLQAKKRRLADLTALSTVTLVLLDPQAAAAPPEEPNGFLAGLAAGWRGLLTSLGVLATVLGWALPWAVLLGVPTAAVLWTVRRRRRPEIS